MPGDTPESPNSREARYAARSSRMARDDTPDINSLLSELEASPTGQGSGPPSTGRGSSVKREPVSGTAIPAVDPGQAQDHRAVFRERRAALQTHHELLVQQLKESADLLRDLPPSPTSSTNPFSPSYVATAATATTSALPQPLALPPAQITARETTHELTHAPAVTSGTTPIQAQTPAQPLALPTLIPFQPIDWDFLSATLSCMQSARGTAVSDVSMAAHRLWAMFAPDTDPTVALALARAATGGVSAEFIGAANSLLLALRRFHTTTGRGHVWTPTELHPQHNATAPSPPRPTTGTLTTTTPSRPTTSTATTTTTTTTAVTSPGAHTESMTEAERRSVRRLYAGLDLRKTTPLIKFPFPDNVDTAVYLGMFFASLKLALGEILVICDESEKQSFDKPPWVVGWDAPLQKCFRKALSSPSVMASPLPRLIDDFFVQLRQELTIDDTGPSAYKKLLRLLTNHFDDGDQGRAFEQLNTFGVPTDTEFSTFVRAFKERVSVAQGTERVFKPSDAMVIEIVRGTTSKQYPSLMPALYPGPLMTAPQPFTTVATMWSAFEVLATNKTPAVNGQRFHASSSGGFTTYSCSPAAPTQQSHPRGSSTLALGSASNPLVMNVVETSPDPFCANESDWPLRHYEEVYMVSTTFNQQIPPLLTPLLTSSARAQALRDHGGHCLNCNGTDHSMKTCPQDFLNTSGILNPALGQLNDGGQAYRQWQRRMCSYRRGQYEHTLNKNQARHSNNNRSNHNNNNNNRNGYYNNRSNHDHSRHNRGNNGRSNNGRHNHGRSYNNGNQQSPGQQYQQQRIEAAATATAPSTAMTVRTPNTSAATTPANMRIGNQASTNPNQRQPGTFRTN